MYLHHHVVDYTAAGALASGLIEELQAAYVQLPQRRREVLLGLIDVHRVAMRTAKDLDGFGLPALAARAVQQCAEELDDAVWLGCAASVRGAAGGELDRAGQYRRSVAAAEILTGRLDSSATAQTCGMLHLMAATAAGACGDHASAVTHLDLFVREAIAGLLRHACRDAGGRELRRLAWRMGIAPIG